MIDVRWWWGNGHDPRVRWVILKDLKGTEDVYLFAEVQNEMDCYIKLLY